MSVHTAALLLMTSGPLSAQRLSHLVNMAITTAGVLAADSCRRDPCTEAWLVTIPILQLSTVILVEKLWTEAH